MNNVLKFSDYKITTPSLKNIEKKYQLLLEEIKGCADYKSLLKSIRKWNKYSDKISTLFSIIYVKYTLNTKDIKAKKNQTIVDEISPILSKYQNEYAKILLSSPFRKQLENKLGKYLFDMYETSLKAFDEKIIPEMIEENKLVSSYDEIIGSAQIDFNGETYNLSQMGKFLTSRDREVRKKAAVAQDSWFLKNETAIGEIYSKLVKVRNLMANKLGFENFIDLGYLRLGRIDYNSNDVNSYRNQISEAVVPLAQKLLKKQMALTGIKNPQYYDYNLSFKSGNPSLKGDKTYLIDEAYKMYIDMSKVTGDFFKYLLDRDLMDLSAKDGKTAGGYCTYFPLYHAPFIFANFNGTQSDVNVLTHEFGHALQAYLSGNIKIPEYRSPTLEACEIHSMSMEFFAWPYMEQFFDNGDKYRYSHLVDAITFLPYGISVDEFQHWVYLNPNASHLERCNKWKEIERKNLPHKKYDDCPFFGHGGWWMKQSHIFATPFYYIDYTLAQVCAFQFLNEMYTNHEKAWNKYIKLCKFGGKAPFVSLLMKNKLRNPFIEGNVKKAIKPLNRILKSFDVKSFN